MNISHDINVIYRIVQNILGPKKHLQILLEPGMFSRKFQSALSLVDVVLMQTQQFFWHGDLTAKVLSLGSFVLNSMLPCQIKDRIQTQQFGITTRKHKILPNEVCLYTYDHHSSTGNISNYNVLSLYHIMIYLHVMIYITIPIYRGSPTEVYWKGINCSYLQGLEQTSLDCENCSSVWHT